jgi:hypothetical protein
LHEKWVTFEVLLKYRLEYVDALVYAEVIETKQIPCLRSALHNAGAAVWTEGVCVEPDESRARSDDCERKGLEYLRRAQPDVLVPPNYWLRLESPSMQLPGSTVGTVACYDQIYVREWLWGIELWIMHDPHSKARCASAKDFEKPLPSNSESATRRGNAHPVDLDPLALPSERIVLDLACSPDVLFR